MKKDSVMRYVQNALGKQTSVYFGCQSPKWIRSKMDAHAGDTVTVYDIPKIRLKKPPFTLRESFAVINHRRVHNGTLLCFDGEDWIKL